MNQFSTSGESVEIELQSREVVLIDPVYLQRIADDESRLQNLSTKNSKDFIKEVKMTFFPYGGGSLIGFKEVDSGMRTFHLDLNDIKQWDSDDNPESERLGAEKVITTFGIDSASFLLFDFKNFLNLLKAIPFDDLHSIDSMTAADFIKEVNSKIGNKGWAYVQTPLASGSHISYHC